jgi:hypothetical protein
MMEDLSLHILDIAENAVAAGATRVRIAVNENERRDVLTVRVTDNGRGMPPEEKARALDPFFTTGRKRTGLGLTLISAPGMGTRVVARFRYSHVDRPPLTKMAETMMALFFGHPGIGFHYRHTRNGSSISVLRRPGGEVSVIPAEIASLGAALRDGLKRIGAS